MLRIYVTVEKHDSYKALHFAYAPNGGLLSEFGRKADKTNRFARDYVWLGNMPIAQIERKVRPDGTTRKAKTTYIHTDHLLAPQSASDEGGQTVWQWNRDAFGQGKVDRDVDGDGKKHVRATHWAPYYLQAYHATRGEGYRAILRCNV